MTSSLGLGFQLGSYRIEAVIGGGATSVVFRAKQVRLGTLAAVKVVAPQWSSDQAVRERFLRDVNLAAELDHRNVIPILDADVHEDSLYVVMRYVAGGDLKTLLARTGALDPARAAAVLGPVAGALDAAHARGLVHGNVKPANVLLERSADGSLDHVYLTDFGTAVLAWSASGLTQGGRSGERFDYTSPEQLDGRDVTPRADVYSLGCVLYHALTGRVPFGESFGGAVDAHEAVEPPSSVRRELPPALDKPVLDAMARDPGQRFATCAELMDAFGAALGSRPVELNGPTPAAVVAPPAAVVAPPAAAVAPPTPPTPPTPPAATSASGDGSRRGPRIRLRTAVALGCALLAAVAGYAASTLIGGDADAGPGGTPVGADADADAAVVGSALRAIVAKSLPELRCTVTRAPAGGPVLENAGCSPRKAGAPALRQVTLTLLPTKPALDALFDNARALTPGAAVRTPGDCRPDLPWGGFGRWFRGADLSQLGGRMFCFIPSAAAREPRIVWTVEDSLVLAEASAADSSALGDWWIRRRHLRKP